MGAGFRVGLADLKRTEGARKQFCLEAGFDDPVDISLVSLPAKRPLLVEVELQSAGDGVLASLRVSVTLDAQCARCLSAFSLTSVVQAEEFFVYPERASHYEDEDVRFIHDESIDLGDVIRDAIILDQELNPVCSPDCRGLCPTCGIDLNANPDHTHGDEADSRWLSLTQWGKMS